MSERTFRLILGSWLLAALFLNVYPAIYVMIAVLVFEGMTNWRIPVLISRLRRMPDASDNTSPACGALRFLSRVEAERALRFVVSLLLVASLFAFPDLLWWVPWFIGFALVAAGLSGICPMVSALRAIGLR